MHQPVGRQGQELYVTSPLIFHHVMVVVTLNVKGSLSLGRIFIKSQKGLGWKELRDSLVPAPPMDSITFLQTRLLLFQAYIHFQLAIHISTPAEVTIGASSLQPTQWCGFFPSSSDAHWETHLGLYQKYIYNMLSTSIKVLDFTQLQIPANNSDSLPLNTESYSQLQSL